MERRRFLKTAGLGLAATGVALSSSWPSLVSRAFGDESAAPTAGPRERAVELAEAIERARGAGKPLLVLVVPTDPQQAFDRGRELGELINHGGPDVADDLLLCEVACATLDEARRALPLAITTEPALVVIELEADGGEFLPAVAVDFPPRAAPTPDGEPAADAAIRQEIAARAAKLRAAVRPTANALARRAERNRTALPNADRAAIAEALASGSAIEPTLARRGAAQLVVAAADGAPEPRARARAALDAAAAKLIVEARPAGAQWASAGGCGMRIEGEKDTPQPPCGMGRVPALSRRFLHFYAKP